MNARAIIRKGFIVHVLKTKAKILEKEGTDPMGPEGEVEIWAREYRIRGD